MNATNLQRQMKNGAYNFYWIAGLSMITSIFFVLSTSPAFVVGLGATQFMDITIHNLAQTIPNSASLVHAIGLVLDFFICGVFALLGFLAAKGHRWAFISGMILFGLDTILTLVSMDLFGFGFHLFFLWFLLSGLQALNKLKEILPDPNPIFPKNTST